MFRADVQEGTVLEFLRYVSGNFPRQVSLCAS